MKVKIRVRLRAVFRHGVRLVGRLRRRNVAAEIAEARITLAEVQHPQQLRLLQGEGGRLPRPRRRRRKKGRAHQRVGLQYRMGLRLRRSLSTAPIKRRFHDPVEGRSEWAAKEAIAARNGLLQATMEDLARFLVTKSPHVLEILRWVNTKGTDYCLSFDSCCLAFSGVLEGEPYNGIDPSVFRVWVMRRVREAFPEGLPPHAEILRKQVVAAEAGDPRAIAWVQSQDRSEYSFWSCCDAIGLNAGKARKEVRIPTTPVEPDSAVHDVPAGALALA